MAAWHRRSVEIECNARARHDATPGRSSIPPTPNCRRLLQSAAVRLPRSLGRAYRTRNPVWRLAIDRTVTANRRAASRRTRDIDAATECARAIAHDAEAEPVALLARIKPAAVVGDGYGCFVIRCDGRSGNIIRPFPTLGGRSAACMGAARALVEHSHEPPLQMYKSDLESVRSARPAFLELSGANTHEWGTPHFGVPRGPFPGRDWASTCSAIWSRFLARH